MDRRSAVHRTIVIVDVEGFGDPRRTNRQQMEIRNGLYQATRDAFSNAGIPWGSCDHEDRGDGIFILVPAEVPKSLIVESLPPALVAALQDHNAKHPGQQPIRLRMDLASAREASQKRPRSTGWRRRRWRAARLTNPADGLAYRQREPDYSDPVYHPLLAWKMLRCSGEFTRLGEFLDDNEYNECDFVKGFKDVTPKLEKRAGIQKRKGDFEPKVLKTASTNTPELGLAGL